MKPTAVLAGFAADILASLFFFQIILAIVGGDSAEEALTRMDQSPELQFSALLVGLGFTAVGGYVAAALARQEHLRNALGVGLLDLGLNIGLALGGGPSSQPIWLQATGLALTVPFALAGGWYRRGTEAPAG